VLATALDAQARLGPASPAATPPHGPSVIAPRDSSPH
jgi:hypothetical protein